MLSYARWATLYYADMLNLEQGAPEVYQECVGDNFVVKKTNGAYNQVPIDYPTEWVNKLCKFSNGIIGITKTDSARDRFCITWGERAIIFEATKYLLGIGDEDGSLTTRRDSFFSRTSKDEADVKSLVEQFERFGIFSVCRSKVAAVDGTTLKRPLVICYLLFLTTNDVGTEDIEDAPLTANTRGAELVRKYVSTCIVVRNIPFFSPMKRQNILKSVQICCKYNWECKKVVKADRRLMQKLLNAQQPGRNVDMSGKYSETRTLVCTPFINKYR